MILDERAEAWQREVRELAFRLGWTPFEQLTRNKRQPAPSLILFRANVVVLVYLRMSSRSRSVPDLERLATATGTQTVSWTPADRDLIKIALM